MDVLAILAMVEKAWPILIKAIEHYNELKESGKLVGEDAEKAKEYLDTLRWKKWEDI